MHRRKSQRESRSLSRDIAAAIRSEPTLTAENLNGLLERQIAEARDRSGAVDLAALLRSISAHYDRIDGERRGIVRSMQLMSDEAQSLTREIREQNASLLQAILDNVKDAILTLDEAGHIVKGGKRHPNVGDHVTIYPNSTILGGETVIGKNSTIGANVFLMHSVPENSLVIYEEKQLTIRNKPVQKKAEDFDWAI